VRRAKAALSSGRKAHPGEHFEPSSCVLALQVAEVLPASVARCAERGC